MAERFAGIKGKGTKKVGATDMGFSFETRNKDDWTAFTFAAMNGFVNIVEFLVTQCQVNINHVDRFKRTALHWSARFNNDIMMERLLKLEIDHTKQDIEGQTCKDLAKAYRCIEAISLITLHEKLLIEAAKEKTHNKLGKF